MLLNCLKIIHGYPTTQLGIKVSKVIVYAHRAEDAR